MKIRSQIVAAIVPLFVGLSLVTGGVMYYLQTKELAWGFHEEASSIAVVTARFLDSKTIQQASSDGPTAQPANEAVPALFKKIMAAGRARRLAIFSVKDQRQLYDVATSNSVSRNLQVPSYIISQLANQSFVIGSIEKGKGNSEYLTTYASIRNSNGEMTGILAVETTADTVQLRRGELLQSLLISMTCAAILGLILTLVISRLITRRLASLTEAVSNVETSYYDQKPSIGIIDELNDLENTFNTLRSVLKEVLSKIWRTIIETEQFRTKEDLMCAFKNEFQSPVQKTIYDIDAAGTLLGCRPMGSFFGIEELQDCGCAVAGKIAESEIMEQTQTASAALAFITQSMKNGDISTSLKSALNLFDLTRCECVIWKKSASKVTHWSLETDSRQWQQETVELPDGVPLVFHTMDICIDKRIRTYVDEFKHLPQETLMHEIRMIVDEKLGGALILIRKCLPEQPLEQETK
jgi:HAMP domain-containing protein